MLHDLKEIYSVTFLFSKTNIKIAKTGDIREISIFIYENRRFFGKSL